MMNYFKKLKENEKKGFSLVELIIVMAIMAILVGVVASQVIPYMEKSRQSKDQQQLSSLCTDIVSAISQAESDPGEITATELSKCTGDWLLELRSAKDIASIETGIQGKLKAKASLNADKETLPIYISRDASGVVTVMVSSDGSAAAADKLEVKSE